MSDKDNMRIWNSQCETPQEWIKRVNMRGGFSSIDPAYQLRCATEMWGPYGADWGIKSVTWQSVGNSIVLSGIFYYPDGEFPYVVDEPFKEGDDSFKKAHTELQSKCLSKLGFSADVYLGMHDNKYGAAERKAKGTSKAPPKPTVDERVAELESHDFTKRTADAFDGTVEHAMLIDDEKWLPKVNGLLGRANDADWKPWDILAFCDIQNPKGLKGEDYKRYFAEHMTAEQWEFLYGERGNDDSGYMKAKPWGEAKDIGYANARGQATGDEPEDDLPF